MNIKDKYEYIFDRLSKDYMYLTQELEYEVVGVFVQGSQNYGLDIYTDEYVSDVDTKAIIIPKFDDFCLNKKPVSTTLTPWGEEHLDVKDIRLMFENFKKANINFTEIMFTQYKIVNPKYEALWNQLLSIREQFVKYDLKRLCNACLGMALEKKKAMCHPYPTLLHKIEKYGYDGKQLHHIIRMYDFVARMLSGETYEQALQPSSTLLPVLHKAKLNQYSLEKAQMLADEYIQETKDAIELFITTYPERFAQIDDECLKQVDTIMIDVIKSYYQSYFSKY